MNTKYCKTSFKHLKIFLYSRCHPNTTKGRWRKCRSVLPRLKHTKSGLTKYKDTNESIDNKNEDNDKVGNNDDNDSDD